MKRLLCICIMLASLCMMTAYASDAPAQPAQGKDLLKATQAAKPVPQKGVNTPFDGRVIKGQVDASKVQPLPAAKADQSVERANPLKAEYVAVMAQIAELQAQGGDFSALKARASELYRQIYAGREHARPLDQGGETCATATPILEVPYCDNGTTIGATNDYAGSCVGASAPDVVYTFTLEQPATVTASLCGSTWDTGLHLWLGCPDAGGSEIICNDDFCGLQSCITVTLSLGTYYLIVDGFGANAGDYGLYVNTIDACTPCPALPPANDDCADAARVFIPSSTLGTTVGATADAAPECGTSVDAAGVWYELVGDGTTLTASLCNDVRNYDTKIHVYTCGCDHLTCVTGIDDFCGLGSQVSWCSSLDEHYLIFVEGYGGETGNFQLDVSSDGVQCEEGAECPCWNEVLQAPASSQGILVGDDCNSHFCEGEDWVIQVWIPTAGEWLFSTCGSGFDTYMYIGTDCCLGDICINDDSECEGVFGLQSNCCVFLEPGVYYVTLEAYCGWNGAGWALDVRPCAPPPSGESCADAIVITGLPFVASGTTVGHTDDHDSDCAYGTSFAPDVVYSFTPAVDMDVNIDLCHAFYDSKVFVIDEAGVVVCCNDDACDNPDYEFDDGFQSYIECCHLLAGHTYCIVVDGYCSTCAGDYTLVVSEAECGGPCVVECPPEATQEGESCEGDINGGCNMAVPTFSPIHCGETVCGSTFASGGTRDTDWWQLVLTHPDSVVACVYAEAPTLIALVAPGAVDPCVEYTILALTVAEPCVVTCVSWCVPAGEYWVVILPPDFADQACADYIAHVECMPCGTGCNPTPYVTFTSNQVPAYYCADLCPEAYTGLVICGEDVDESRPPIVTVTPGCDPQNTNCERDCDAAEEFYYDPQGWALDGNCWYNYIIGGQGCVCICLEGFLGVELNSFAAISHDGSVELNWSTAAETNNERFDIVRNGETVAQVATQGNGATEQDYTWMDRNVVNGTTYTYALVSVDVNGNREEVATTEATPTFGNAMVTEYALHQNYPNPFNPETNITFDLVENGNVTLSVYNLMGQQVATLVNGLQEAGRHTISFDATSLPSGVYLYKLDVNGLSFDKKMVLMK